MRFPVIVAALLASASTAQAAPCGGSFSSYIAATKAEAVAQGYPQNVVDQFFNAARQDPKVLAADRRQGIFKTDFIDFTRKLISQNRLDNGRRNAQKYDSIFNTIERDIGVPHGILLAFWAFETDFGGFQGDFNTLNALATLSHDCRRPELFQPQLMAALELYKRGDFDTNTTGAWAGEIGQVQMLPKDILEQGTDGDGDGQVNLKTSVPDALFSGANMLRGFGWRAGEPWMQEIIVPSDLPWEFTGLDDSKPVAEWAELGVQPRSGTFLGPNLRASVMLPMGRRGPAFFAYPNYQTLFEWNQSFVYVATAAYFATRLEGASPYDPGNPDPSLSDAEMKLLQQKLADLGHDVGKIDGILGSGTRNAVQAEQRRLGLPADSWPTRELINKL
jgi:lytic murein transglycosylase